MSLVLNGTTGITNLPSINSGPIGGRRNIVYNGEMKVAQRSTSTTGLGGATGCFTLDRWNMLEPTANGHTAQAGRYTMAQVADGPVGFANCLKLTVTTADTSIAANEILFLHQRFEGQDLQQLAKGTASTEQVTVSFYVKGNAAALYVCELFDADNSRSITQSFAVTTDWNRIELTFAADTSDPLDDDTAASLFLNIWLHGGSTYTGGTFAVNTWNDQTAANRYAVANRTSIFDSTNRTFFITGVQMEIGTQATDFESRSFNEELALCQRYYEKSYDYDVAPGTTTYVGTHKGGGGSTTRTTSYLSGNSPTFQVQKRDNPTIVVYDQAGAAGKCQRWELGVVNTNNSTVAVGDIAMKGFLFYSSGSQNATGVQCHYTAESEL